MIIRLLLILSYILWCIRFRLAPWKYFQLNALYFNEHRHIFSKLEMDRLIPEAWRLAQVVDKVNVQPTHYPVFIKPEWGQNSQGVCRLDNLKQLQQHRQRRLKNGPRYLIQAAAKGLREFEVFYIPAAKSDLSCEIISVTETCNSSSDKMPVNGIYNNDTRYRSCMAQLSAAQVQQIKSLFSPIGDFKIARYCARADSLTALLAGHFSIVEINVYVPMPLMLLAENVSIKRKLRFILASMKQLALVTKDISSTQVDKPIFFKKLQSARLLKATVKNGLS